MMKYASTYDTHTLTLIHRKCSLAGFWLWFLFLLFRPPPPSFSFVLSTFFCSYILHMATKAMLIPLLKNYFKLLHSAIELQTLYTAQRQHPRIAHVNDESTYVERHAQPRAFRHSLRSLLSVRKRVSMYTSSVVRLNYTSNTMVVHQ